MVIATVLLALLAAGAGLAVRQSAAPSDTPIATVEPTYIVTPSSSGTPIAVPSPTTLHRYADKDESAFIASCVADAPSASVPTPVAQAFCVCTLNAYETIYPTYDALNAAVTSGALTQQTRTQISDRCVQSLLGG